VDQWGKEGQHADMRGNLRQMQSNKRLTIEYTRLKKKRFRISGKRENTSVREGLVQKAKLLKLKKETARSSLEKDG